MRHSHPLIHTRVGVDGSRTIEGEEGGRGTTLKKEQEKEKEGDTAMGGKGEGGEKKVRMKREGERENFFEWGMDGE